MLVDLLEDIDAVECSNCEEMWRQIAHGDVELVLLDVYFPGLNAEDDIRVLRQDHPLIGILVVSMLTDRPVIERLLHAGANGFVSKSAPPETMSAGVIEVLNGERPIYLPAANRGRPRAALENPVDGLPPRLMEVLKLICMGLSNKEIARELDLSVSTVRAHVSALFQKLGVSNRAAAASIGASSRLWTSADEVDQGGS